MKHIDSPLRQEVQEPESVRPDEPNRITVAALQEAERISKDPSVKGYTDLETLFRDLKN